MSVGTPRRGYHLSQGSWLKTTLLSNLGRKGIDERNRLEWLTDSQVVYNIPSKP